MLNFYGYKKCGTSRKGEKFLTERGVEYLFIDITLNPPARKELEKIVERSGKPLKKFFNTSGVLYREMNMKEKLKTMSDAEILDLLASEGKLIKRPVVTNSSRATVGFNDVEFEEWKE